MTEPHTDQLLRSTSEAFATVLHAVLDADTYAAAEVLRGSAVRRGHRRAADEVARDHAWTRLPHLADHLQFVSDLGRIGDLVDHLARHVVAGGDRVPLSPAGRMEVAVLLDAGGCRLSQLQAGATPGDGLDPDYRRCGSTLFEIAGRAVTDRSATVALCGALAAALLQATRHAARAVA